MCSNILWVGLEELNDTWSVDSLEKSVKTDTAMMYIKKKVNVLS